MCWECGCARPNDDGPDHDAIPGGLAEVATLRSQHSVLTSGLGRPDTGLAPADDVLAPIVAPRTPTALPHEQARKED